MNREIKIVDMKPIGYYADRSPQYSFGTSFPTLGVKELPKSHETKEEAYKEGQEYVRNYEAADVYGNMGQVIGVSKKEDGFHAVVNTYHSNT